MDPISAIGAAASIVSLAQTALALSTTLYSVCGALATASEDLQILAEDLKVFSQSLTLLSRLLEDNKAWYCDEIYLLTAKIIRDCVSLYEKIDAIVVKLDSRRKTRWTKSIMFVVKGPQIRKLLERLRYLKGTLATILMSLQVDLQLSLLNISSPSKIQRTAQEPLQPGTVRVLDGVEKTVREFDLLSTLPMPAVNDVDQEKKSNSIDTHVPNQIKTEDIPNPQNLISSATSVLDRSMAGTPDINQKGSARSVSSSSIASFETATSQLILVTEQVGVVKDIIYAFRLALDALTNLIKKRMGNREDKLQQIGQNLKSSLTKGRMTIDEAHSSHFKTRGEAYIKRLNDSLKALQELQAVKSKLLVEVVIVLLMLNAEHTALSSISLDNPQKWSRSCRIKTLFEMDSATLPVLSRLPKLVLFTTEPSLTNSWCPNESSLNGSLTKCLNSMETVVTVTEEQVEERVLIDKNWLARLPRAEKASKPSSLGSHNDFTSLTTRGSKKASKRSVYFINGEGIDSEVITADICRYLGNNTLVKPGTYNNPKNMQMQEGFYITAHGPPTPAQLKQIRNDSAIWREEKRKSTIRGYQLFKRWIGLQGSSSYGTRSRNTFRRSIYHPPGLKALSQSQVAPSGFPALSISYNDPLESFPPCSKTKITDGQDIHDMFYDEQLSRIPLLASPRRKSRDREQGQILWQGAINESSTGYFRNQTDPEYQNAQQISLEPTRPHSMARKMSLRVLPPEIETRTEAEMEASELEAERVGEREVGMMARTCSATRGQRTTDFAAGPVARPERGARAVTGQPVNGASRGSSSRGALNIYQERGLRKQDDTGWKELLQQQQGEIWRQAVERFHSTDPDQLKRLVEMLLKELSYENNSERNLTQWSTSILKLLRRLKTGRHNSAGIQIIQEKQDTTIKIFETISQAFGLESALLAWGCVVVLVQKLQASKLHEEQRPVHLDVITKTLRQIQEIAGMIARYTVMENLYRQTRSMNLQSDYKSALIQLCCEILDWFSNAFILATYSNLRAIFTIDELWKSIKENDQTCQSFRIAVEAKEESGTSDVEIEDMSNDSSYSSTSP